MSIFVWIALLAGGFSFILSGVCFVWLIVYDENIKRVGRIANNLHDRLVTIKHTATNTSEIHEMVTAHQQTANMLHFTISYSDPPLRSSRLAAEGAVVCLLAEFRYNIWKIEWSDCGRVMEIYCNHTTGSPTEDQQ